MTFPQTSSTQPVKDGQQFWRLSTQIETSGDMYESEVGALGFALGPNSDIARVLITYLDINNKQTGVGQFVLSPDRSFSGLVSAINTQTYETSFSQAVHRKGRILISVDDYFNTRFRPDAFNGSNDVIQYEIPILDVIQYFKNLPSVIPQRSDRTFGYQYLQPPPVATNSSWVMLPAYGRKSGFFQIQNLDGSNTVTARVFGIKFNPTGLGTPAGGTQVALTAATALIAPSSLRYAYKSSTDGDWDVFGIQLANYHGAAMPISVTLSDDVS